jgi:hypothetical protein
VVPIILNVKGFDLFTIDQPNKNFDPDEHLAAWNALGVTAPQPFQNVRYLAPQMPGGAIAISTPAYGTVNPYSWSLSDIIEQNLLLYLFSERDADDINFSALVLDIDAWLTDEHVLADGTTTRHLKPAINASATNTRRTEMMREKVTKLARTAPTTTAFHKLHRTAGLGKTNVADENIGNSRVVEPLSRHLAQVIRRLGKILAESRGVLRRTNCMVIRSILRQLTPLTPL